METETRTTARGERLGDLGITSGLVRMRIRELQNGGQSGSTATDRVRNTMREIVKSLQNGGDGSLLNGTERITDGIYPAESSAQVSGPKARASA